MLPRFFRPLGHRVKHLFIAPAAGVAFAGDDDDFPIELGVVQLLRRRFEAMHRVVEEVVIRIAHPDMDFAVQQGTDAGPFGFENISQVMLLPVPSVSVTETTLGAPRIGSGRSTTPDWTIP